MNKRTGLLGILLASASTLLFGVEDKSSTIRYLDPIFPAVEKVSAVVYKKTLDEDNMPLELAMDIYQPADDTLRDRPLVFFFHSGGFSSGHRNSFTARWICTQLAQRGYVAASASYRLKRNPRSDPRTFPDAMEDAADAIAWLQENAAEYQIDPDSYALWGASAGSVLAVNLAYSRSGNKQPASYNCFGLVAMAGYSLVNTNPLPGNAPALLIHGSEDPNGLSSEDLIKSLDRAGIHHTLYEIEGIGHNLNGYLDICTQAGIPTLYKHLSGKIPDSGLPSKDEALKKAVSFRITHGPEILAPQVKCDIDGNKTEWLDLDWQPFGALKDLGESMPDPVDFSASGIVGWNPETPFTLYGCFEVRDDKLWTDSPENNIYNLMNDNVEVIIDFSNDSLLMKPLRWWIRIDGSEYSSPFSYETLAYAVSRSEMTSIVEFSIDFSKLNPDMNTLGISLMADDAENSTLEHQIGITPGASWERRHFLNLRLAD